MDIGDIKWGVWCHGASPWCPAIAGGIINFALCLHYVYDYVQQCLLPVNKSLEHPERGMEC